MCASLHVSTDQNAPVSSLLPALMTAPTGPPSILVPPKALSNLWMGKKERIPSARSSSSPASIACSEHSGTSSLMPHPNSRDTSAPSTTASLPALMTFRAWKGSVTIRNHPLPGPPDCASM